MMIDEEIKRMLTRCRVDAQLIISRIELILALTEGKLEEKVSNDEPYDCPIHGTTGTNGECPRC